MKSLTVCSCPHILEKTHVNYKSNVVLENSEVKAHVNINLKFRSQLQENIQYLHYNRANPRNGHSERNTLWLSVKKVAHDAM
jgi:hypothetical protein